MSGAVLFPIESAAAAHFCSSWTFANTGLSEAAGALQLSTNGALAMSISSTQIPTFSALGLGILHSSSGGVVSSELGHGQRHCKTQPSQMQI